MPPRSITRTLLNGTAWTILGVLLTVFLFYFTEYRRRYDLQLIVANDVDLVEVRERVEGLKISYNGEDLLQTGRRIRLLGLTLQNNGETILQQQYDNEQPFGISFPDSLVLSATVTSTNSSYLRDRVTRHWDRLGQSPQKIPSFSGTSGFLPLPKAIIERGRNVTLQVTLLQPRVTPETRVVPIGKITNLSKITVTRATDEAEVDAQGELVKMFGLIMAGYILFFGLLFSIIYAVDQLSLRRKARKIKAFISSRPKLGEQERQLIQVYKDEWSPRLSRIAKVIVGGGEAIDLSAYVETEVRRLTKKPDLILRFFMPRLRFLELPSEFFMRDGQVVRFNEENREFIQEFLEVMEDVRSPN